MNDASNNTTKLPKGLAAALLASLILGGKEGIKVSNGPAKREGSEDDGEIDVRVMVGEGPQSLKEAISKLLDGEPTKCSDPNCAACNPDSPLHKHAAAIDEAGKALSNVIEAFRDAHTENGVARAYATSALQSLHTVNKLIQRATDAAVSTPQEAA